MFKNIEETPFIYSFLRDPSALFGAALIFIFAFCAVFAPWLAPMDPYDLTAIDLGNFLLPPGWMEGEAAIFPWAQTIRAGASCPPFYTGCAPP